MKNKKQKRESLIAFQLARDGLPQLIIETASATDALALFAFAKEVAEQEITRLTLEARQQDRDKQWAEWKT